MEEIFQLDSQLLSKNVNFLMKSVEERKKDLMAYDSQVHKDIQALYLYLFGDEVEHVQGIADKLEWYFKSLIPDVFEHSPLYALIQMVRMGYRMGQLHHLLSLENGAKLTKKSANAIYKDIKNHKIQGYKIERQWYVNRFDLLDKGGGKNEG